MPQVGLHDPDADGQRSVRLGVRSGVVPCQALARVPGQQVGPAGGDVGDLVQHLLINAGRLHPVIIEQEFDLEWSYVDLIVITVDPADGLRRSGLALRPTLGVGAKQERRFAANRCQPTPSTPC